jgi:uncharacterized membrane-anchored protein YjiN (DUF445 family)
MSIDAPPIVKLTETVLVEVELAVRSFPRYHKYSVGADLRRDAREVARAAIRAWRDHEHRGDRLGELAAAIDDLKLTLQLAQRVEAFKSFKQFEALARTISNLGRQCGGWQRKHLKGQNRTATTPAGRAQTLSARGASNEAHP